MERFCLDAGFLPYCIYVCDCAFAFDFCAGVFCVCCVICSGGTVVLIIIVIAACRLEIEDVCPCAVFACVFRMDCAVFIG